jgi:hypothetical protein
MLWTNVRPCSFIIYLRMFRAARTANASNMRATALFLWMARQAKRLACAVNAKR